MPGDQAANRCACHHHDAKTCFRSRYSLDIKEMLGEALSADEEDETCCCSCHREHELEMYDLMEADLDDG